MEFKNEIPNILKYGADKLLLEKSNTKIINNTNSIETLFSKNFFIIIIIIIVISILLYFFMNKSKKKKKEKKVKISNNVEVIKDKNEENINSIIEEVVTDIISEDETNNENNYLNYLDNYKINNKKEDSIYTLESDYRENIKNNPNINEEIYKDEYRNKRKKMNLDLLSKTYHDT